MKLFFEEFYLGIRTYIPAIRLSFHKRLVWAYAVPVVLNILLFVGGYELIAGLISYTRDWFIGLVDFDQYNFWGYQVLNDVFYWLIGVLFTVLAFLFFVFLGGYLVLILMSPVLAYVSELTESLIKKTDYPFSFKQLLKDIYRGLYIAMRNLLIETLVMLLVFIIGFIPVLGWLGPLILFAVSAYYYGFAYMDYCNERKRIPLGQRIAFIRRHKGLASGNGSLFALALLIPFCGIFIAGFLAIVSTIAAALSVEEIYEQAAAYQSSNSL